MHDLQLIGVHEDGEHLLLSGAGNARFRMPVDEALRAAVRRDRPHLGKQPVEGDDGLRPRDVQALIRAGASADEAASRAGWTLEKVHRYEGPILAEREHVAGLAQKCRLHTRAGGSGGSSAPTLSARVTERLKERDVEVTDSSWDSWRAEDGPWTVVLTFAAGGRQRQASWTFNLADRTVSAVDDEARWLSEEVQAAKGPIPPPRTGPRSGRASTVYDVEAEGGLQPTDQAEHQDDPLDLMSAMRKRSTARGRRKPGGHRGSSRAAAELPELPELTGQSGDPALPLDDLPDREIPKRDIPKRDIPKRDIQDEDHPEPSPADGAHQRAAEPTLLDVPESDSAANAPARDHSSPDDNAQQDSSPGDSSPGDSSPGDSSPGDSSPGDSSPGDSSPGDPAEGPKPSGESRDAGQPKARKAGRIREAPRKQGRPSVPAWDEIMFGARPGAGRSS